MLPVQGRFYPSPHAERVRGGSNLHCTPMHSQTPAVKREFGITKKTNRTSGCASIILYRPNPRGLIVPVTGRSSGLSILILLRLPRLTPSGWYQSTVRYLLPEAKLLSHSDGFAQVFHLLPFSSDPNHIPAVRPTPVTIHSNFPNCYLNTPASTGSSATTRLAASL